jgi:hypothetical protein
MINHDVADKMNRSVLPIQASAIALTASQQVPPIVLPNQPAKFH